MAKPVFNEFDKECLFCDLRNVLDIKAIEFHKRGGGSHGTAGAIHVYPRFGEMIQVYHGGHNRNGEGFSSENGQVNNESAQTIEMAPGERIVAAKLGLGSAHRGIRGPVIF